jgi:hypothetical protein
MSAPELPSPRFHGEAGIFPLRSPCPAGCKFCYETHLPRLVPNVQILRTPGYSLEAFEEFSDGLSSCSSPMTPVSPIFVHEGILHYSSMSDIFCQGLSLEQLERLIRQNIGKERRLLATTGNHLDPETAGYLTTKYPETFRLHYSAVTLSPELRPKLFTHWVAPDVVLKTLSVLREPKVYLCNFDPRQSIEDLQAVNAHAQPGARVQIARMHCTRMHSEELRELARRSGHGFGEVAVWLKSHRATLGHIAEIGFQAPAEGYAWTFREALRALVQPLQLGPEDVVLCSAAAGNVLRGHVIPVEAAVVPVFDSLGGTTSFAQTISTENILGVLRALREEREFSRVVLPSSIFWVAGQYAVDGRSVDDIRSELPGVEIAIVEIPSDMTDARLTVEECLRYFSENPGASASADYREC